MKLQARPEVVLMREVLLGTSQPYLNLLTEQLRTPRGEVEKISQVPPQSGTGKCLLLEEAAQLLLRQPVSQGLLHFAPLPTNLDTALAPAKHFLWGFLSG